MGRGEKLKIRLDTGARLWLGFGERGAPMQFLGFGYGAEPPPRPESKLAFAHHRGTCQVLYSFLNSTSPVLLALFYRKGNWGVKFLVQGLKLLHVRLD